MGKQSVVLEHHSGVPFVRGFILARFTIRQTHSQKAMSRAHGQAQPTLFQHAEGDPEPVAPPAGGQTCARCPASGPSCPPRKRPGAGSDFGRSSRWPGAAGWRPRGGGAARPARGVARKLPAASGATIWPLYA